MTPLKDSNRPRTSGIALALLCGVLLLLTGKYYGLAQERERLNERIASQAAVIHAQEQTIRSLDTQSNVN